MPRSADPGALPHPRLNGPVSLEAAIAARRSIRELSSEPLQARELSQLLWALQGVTGEEGLRATPSAGALYPLEIFVATAEGLHHYEPQRHRLARSSADDLRPALCRAALSQEPVAEAPAVFVIAAVPARTARKYGPTRSRRYVYMEVGHAAQNLLLQGAALGLAAVPIAAFEDARVKTVLGLPEDHDPLYLIPVGRPR